MNSPSIYTISLHIFLKFEYLFMEMSVNDAVNRCIHELVILSFLKSSCDGIAHRIMKIIKPSLIIYSVLFNSNITMQTNTCNFVLQMMQCILKPVQSPHIFFLFRVHNFYLRYSKLFSLSFYQTRICTNKSYGCKK